MAQQSLAGVNLRGKTLGGGAGAITVPVYAVRFAGAMHALAVTTVHVADQGGVTALTSPDWIGWGYRLIELGGVLTALILGVPGGPGDVGNWGYWVGTVSLLVEAALVTISVSMLLTLNQQSIGGALRGLAGRGKA